MATIECFVSKDSNVIEKIIEFAKNNGHDLEEPIKIKYGSLEEKLLKKFITYGVRYYHSGEKCYRNKRLGSGVAGRKRAELERDKIKSLVEAKAIGALKKDYPIFKLLNDYKKKPIATHSEVYVKRNLQIINHFFNFLEVVKPKVSKVSQINLNIINKYIQFRQNIKQKKVPKNKTIQNEIAFLNALITNLIDKGIIDEKPLEKIPYAKILPTKGDSKEISVLTEVEALKMCELAWGVNRRKWFGDVLFFVCYTGARESDIISLQIDDIDFENKLIHFKEKKQIEYFNSRGAKKVIKYRPKSTGSEIRNESIPIHNNLFMFLQKLCESARKSDDKIVFRNSMEVPIPEGMLRKMTAKMSKEIGRPDVTSFHQFRHLYADKIMSASNGDPHGARMLLRHKNLVTSSEYLRHTNIEKMRSVIDNVNYSNVEKSTFNDSVNYVFGGNIILSSRDNCPSCKGIWKDKLHNPKCKCGVQLRKDLKIFIGDKVCFQCNHIINLDTRECGDCKTFHDESLFLLSNKELVDNIS